MPSISSIYNWNYSAEINILAAVSFDHSKFHEIELQLQNFTYWAIKYESEIHFFSIRLCACLSAVMQ